MKIKSAEDVFNFVLPKFLGLDREHFRVLLLNSKNKIIKDELVSIGGLNFALIHPREIFKSAIINSANSLVIVHNHPSGESEPSEEDKKITERLFDIGEFLDIKVLDHVIVCDSEYYSFREH